MMERTEAAPPVGPVLRLLELAWTMNDGQMFLRVRDPLELSGEALLVPRALAPLLGLLDGSRGPEELKRDFESWTHLEISLDQVRQALADLDRALLLDNDRYRSALAAALEAYHAAPHRPMAFGDTIYPSRPQELKAFLDGFGGPPAGGIPDLTPITGIISPHIDYHRGGKTYAQVWGRAAAAVRAAELVVMFGTDHAGQPGLTLTTQSYATPFGVLPTPRDLVDRLAAALGPERAFQFELHHRKEHSIELAAVWMHAVRQGQPVEMVPVLCGSFAPYTNGLLDPEANESFAAMIDVLRAESLRRRVLVVAAGDLAHVGTEFGDPEPVSPAGRVALMQADQRLLAACAQADHRAFFNAVRGIKDQNRICGLPPIYFALRLLGAARGEVLGYDQCPADPNFGSVVSIAGVVLRRLL